MAIQNENRHFAGVKVAGPTGAIVARSALVASVVREGVGSYLITYSKGIAAAEEVHGLCLASDFSSESAELALGAVERVSDTQYRVRTFDNAGAAFDQSFTLNMHQVSNTNGL